MCFCAAGGAISFPSPLLSGGGGAGDADTSGVGSGSGVPPGGVPVGTPTPGAQAQISALRDSMRAQQSAAGAVKKELAQVRRVCMWDINQ